MKQYQLQFESNRSRNTLSDLKLKKTIQASNQENQLNKINNSLKFKQPKLTPIIGQITIIPIRPQAAIVKQMLLGKQVMKIQGQLRKFKKIEQIERKCIKTEATQKIKENQTEMVSFRLFKNQQTRKGQQKFLSTLSQIKQTSKLKSPANNSYVKNLPRLHNEQKPRSQKNQFPLLSSFDSNLRNITSLHYYILQHQTQVPVICHRSKAKIQVASLTKIMTFYTVYKICQQFQLQPKQVQIPIEYQMTDISGTTALLQQNQVYNLQQLLYGLMLPSGNDASLAIAIWGGRKITPIANAQSNCPIKQFVQKMNSYAKQLKMLDTSYGNPHGLPHRNNKTTCQDVAKLCSKCLQIPLFKTVVGTKIYKFKFYHTVFKKKLVSHWQNTNKLLRRPGFIGLKTGITVTAGPCLASAYQFLNKTYIVIIAKSTKPSRRFKQTRRLLVHCLQRINHGKQLQKQQLMTLKKLGKGDEDIDSDYSDDQFQFNFSSFSPQQIKRRTRILTQI